jgi:PAS domain S-box-containing protein
VQAAVCSFRDVSESRRAETALRESEARFRRLSDASPDGIAINERGTIVNTNRALERMLGYGDGELIGKTAADITAPESMQLVLGRIAQGIEGSYEAVGLRRDGTRLPLEVSAKQIAYEGRPARVTVFRDLTERTEIDRMKNEFVSTVSHELRTPLTSIRGSLGLIEGGVAGDVPPKVLELTRIARTNADRLIRLINDILDLAKIEAGKLELRVAPVLAADVVAATLEGIGAVAAPHGVRLTSHVEHDRPIPADRDRVIQVLTNLLSNAIKFSPHGGEVAVRVAAPGPGMVRFSVEDRGPGIPAGQLGRLFRKFGQLDGSDTRRSGGTGLGLAISRSIVEEHGGTIGVESEPGVRTTFWFDLPSGGRPAAEPPAGSAAPATAPPASRRRAPGFPTPT